MDSFFNTKKIQQLIAGLRSYNLFIITSIFSNLNQLEKTN